MVLRKHTMKNYISNVVRKRAAALFGAAGVAMAVM
jgi:hypothetical protein